MSETCTVWWAAPVAPTAAPALADLLDAHERDRLGRFRRLADRARYVAAHALVRLVLADLTGTAAGTLEFDRTCRCGAQHGKPRLAPELPGFSLSHTGGLVGVAVWSGGPVGLDVEQVRHLSELPGMFAHVCSPAELARDAPAGPAAFFTVWTRKEALLKATGHGLASPMARITLAPAGAPAGVEEWTGDGAPSGPMWLRDLRPAAGCIAALGGPGSVPPTVVVADGDAMLQRGLAAVRPSAGA